MAGNEDVPQELVGSFEDFSNLLDHVEEVTNRLVEIPRNKLLQDLTPMEVAKLDLASAYSINSLFWMYLITQGVNPRKHEIKGELDRIKHYMGKVKEIEDRGKAPKLQKEAAKRFVRNAMFDLESKNKEKHAETEHEQQDNGTDNNRQKAAENEKQESAELADISTSSAIEHNKEGKRKGKRKGKERKRHSDLNEKPHKKKKSRTND